MRIIKTMPQTEAQIENYNRYGAAILITGTLAFLVQIIQTVADFYSLYPPFYKKFLAASPQYGNAMAIMIAIAIPGLIAFATHFLYGLALSMYFNKKYKNPDTILFGIVCLAGLVFAGGQYYVSTEGGKNAAIENFSYKASLKDESEADKMYDSEASQANILFRSDSTLISESYSGQIATAQTRINNADDKDKNWLRNQLNIIQAKKAEEMKAIQGVRNAAISSALSRKNNSLSSISGYNTKEQQKQDLEETKYSEAGKWVAIILIPLFAFLKWLNSKFNHICGIEIQIVSSEHDFEDSILGKLWYAVNDSIKGQMNNFAVWIHTKLKPKEIRKFGEIATGLIEFNSNGINSTANNTGLVMASNEEKKPKKIGFVDTEDTSVNYQEIKGTVNVSNEKKECLHCGKELHGVHWLQKYCNDNDDYCKFEAYKNRTGKTLKIHKHKHNIVN